MVQSTCTSIWYIVLYIKQNRHGKETDPCYGFLLLGQWPVELWATHPHTHKKTIHIKNVFMHHTDHRDRSAGRPWCWHWSRFLKQQNTVLCLTRNDTQPKCLFLLCQIVPQSSFWPVSMLVSYSCFVRSLCDSSSFVSCFNSSSQRCANSHFAVLFSSCHLVHLAGRTRSLNN